ncbi:CLI_3235 family bacteriocin precursor [Paenibacillus monticola]|uniref:CLI_3235 family bacteriocin n=1 Tax=Paenibacillus monticola TaxID=2666075 RepID=A0A7X2L4Y5_9BACL|nr:CLI_3235 family bacteriocin precursor [Paenibacillus monticola]MRN55836.1 CLI_3235 family bacteriocin precursor [Paenibacillus monticola]
MKKLYKKNISHMHTVEAYADCHLSCACYCPTCNCLVSNYLSIADTRVGNNAIAMQNVSVAAAQVK